MSAPVIHCDLPETCAFVDHFGNEVWTSGLAYQEIRYLRERLEGIGYHAAQLGTYVAQSSITEKHLASARFHAGKIVALAKARGEQSL